MRDKDIYHCLNKKVRVLSLYWFAGYVLEVKKVYLETLKKEQTFFEIVYRLKYLKLSKEYSTRNTFT